MPIIVSSLKEKELNCDPLELEVRRICIYFSSDVVVASIAELKDEQ